METSAIHWKLDLLVRLIDTTTGMAVEESDAGFLKDGRQVYPVSRGSGNFVFENCGREDCRLEITVYGYEPCTLIIRYEELDERMPIAEAYLIPLENAVRGGPVVTLSGQLPGLDQIQAASLGLPRCRVSEYNARKRTLKLIKTNSAGMYEKYYGLIHSDGRTFEPMCVEKELSENELSLSRPLTEPCSQKDPIVRIVFGSVSPDGHYTLRVRDDSDQLFYLIRYVVNGETRFKTVDMHLAAEAVLE